MLVASVAQTEEAMVDGVQQEINRIVDEEISGAVTPYITGTPTIDLATKDQSLDTARRAELLALPILFLVLLLILRAPVAALVLTAFGGVTTLMSFGAMALLGKAIDVDATAVAVASMAGLALGVSYAMLVYRRWRTERGAWTRTGLQETAAAATGAAAVMLAAIIPFAMVDLLTVQVFGVGVAIAIILDALIVRPVLLPAAAVACSGAGAGGRCRGRHRRLRLPPARPRPRAPRLPAGCPRCVGQRRTTDAMRWQSRWRAHRVGRTFGVDPQARRYSRCLPSLIPIPVSSSASTARRRRMLRSRAPSSASGRTASSTSSMPGSVPEAWRGRGTYQPYVDRALTAAEAVMEAAVEAHPGLKGITWERELIGGPPAKAIADVADVRRADEIILGTRGFGRVRALLGSVAHELIHLAPCPVTVIPERMVEHHAEARVSATA